MVLGNGRAFADRFAAYVKKLTKVIGHGDREGPPAIDRSPLPVLRPPLCATEFMMQQY